MTSKPSTDSRSGLFFGLGAYGLWGLVPLYFKRIAHISPVEVLAHRIVWSVAFLAVLLTLTRRRRELLDCFREARIRTALMGSTVLIAVNWLVYIYGVSIQQIVQTSLGYFMTPLINVVLGMIVYRERLRGGQWLAVLLASSGVLYLTLVGDEFPWIALSLAFSFGLYGLVRKRTPVESSVGLMAETVFLLPPAFLILLYLSIKGTLGFGSHGWEFDILLSMCGVVTAVPLLCFGQAARRLRLTTLGFLQFLSPSLQLLLAVLLYGEPFERDKVISFCCIWGALLLYTLDSVLAYRKRAMLSETVGGEEEKK